MGGVGSGGTDGAERRMAGRVNKRYTFIDPERSRRVDGLPAYLVRCDVLGDATSFFCDGIRLADEIKKRGLAMVHMPHDHNDGGPLDEFFVLCGHS